MYRFGFTSTLEDLPNKIRSGILVWPVGIELIIGGDMMQIYSSKILERTRECLVYATDWNPFV